MEHPVHAIFVVVYLMALIGVGAMKAGKIKSQADFSLAGRGLSTFVLVGTLLATWIGTGSIFGNAEKTYRIGVGAFILPIASVVGIILLWRLAARIRGLEQFTIQDILERRFGVATRIMGMIALMLAYVIIVSYQYRAGAAVIGYLVPSLQGTALATILVALFVIAYTALAGMFSVAYTDVANGILMVVGIAIALPILFSQVGGFEGMAESLPANHQDMWATHSPFTVVNLLLPAFLLILGDANIYQRFFSAKSPAVARRSAAWLILGIAVVETAIIAVALLGRALVDKGDLQTPAQDAHVIVAIAFHALPPFLGAMLMGTVIAIVVSTADSFLLAPSTSFVRDVYKRFISPEADEARVVLLGRAVVVIFGLVALVLSFQSGEFLDVALLAYTIYGCSITPVMLAAFFWPRATKSGATWGMASGIVTTLVWKWLSITPSDAGPSDVVPPEEVPSVLASFAESIGQPWIAEMDAVFPALFMSLGVLITVSLAGKPPDAEQARSV